MALNDAAVEAVVREVFDELARRQGLHAADTDGTYETVDEAVEGAVEAQKRLIRMTLETRDKIIEALRKAVLDNNEMLSAMAIRESGLGRYEDKIRENILCATRTPGTEDLRPLALSGDHGLMLLEYAPVGVIGALTPITNPTGTLIHNSISMVAAGNAVVFNAHPSAMRTSLELIKLFHQAVVEAGGPPGLIASVRKPTQETGQQIMEHPKVNMLVATGGRPIVNLVLRSGKKAIGAGAGNPPVLVDETAHIRNAAECIINGASINNNVFCTCEKEVFVVDEVATALIKFMQETGKAYLLNREEAERVTNLVVTPERRINNRVHWQGCASHIERRGYRDRRRIPSGHFRSPGGSSSCPVGTDDAHHADRPGPQRERGY